LLRASTSVNVARPDVVSTAFVVVELDAGVPAPELDTVEPPVELELLVEAPEPEPEVAPVPAPADPVDPPLLGSPTLTLSEATRRACGWKTTRPNSIDPVWVRWCAFCQRSTAAVVAELQRPSTIIALPLS
jgi:hypothetical protein